jgi:hypothetical protein
MIARHRGDERIHSRWQPRAAAGTSPASASTHLERLDKRRDEQLDGLDRPRARRRRLWASIAIVLVLAVIALQHHGRPTADTSLPSTPTQWVDQWTAAAIDNPGRVCRQLFAPALAAVFKADVGRSCLDYYNDVNAKSFRIRHVLVDGNAAAVEVREVGMRPNWGYVTMLLSHLKQGWQAVDIVPGGPVRPR